MKFLKEMWSDHEKREMAVLIVSALSLVAGFIQGHDHFWNAAWIAVLLCGVPIVIEAAEGLFTRFDIRADVLVAIALIAALCIGEVFAAGEVAFIMLLGEMLEERTVEKARAGIERLLNLMPASARLIADGGVERIVSPEELKAGDRIRVLGGENIPADGVILEGRSAVDQSVITGESLPVDKEIGDEVFSGTINQFGVLEIKVTHAGEESSLKKMIALVESADAKKAKIVGVTDRWATWIVVLALVSAFGTWLVTGEMIRAVAILVVFCPCALVLATPTAIMAGIGNASKFGILVRQGDALERLSRIRTIVFDKTGTLTSGKLSVVGIRSFMPEISEEELLKKAAALESHSEHPLAKTVTSYFVKRHGTIQENLADFEMIPGRGVSASVDGKYICAGNEKFMSDNHIPIAENALKEAENLRAQGATVIFVSFGKSEINGLIALADTVRPSSKNAVAELKSEKMECVLLSGDHAQAAEHIAKETGISHVYSECLPVEKMAFIERKQEQGEAVCMVGDGVNDAAALKAADVGIAMGGIGSDIAIDAADAVFVHDDISALPHFVRLSRKTMNTIYMNVTFSLLVNFAAIFLAMFGWLSPLLGALVHNIGAVIVILNSAYLYKWRSESLDQDDGLVEKRLS